MFYFNETYRHCQGRKRFSSTNNLLSVLLLLCGLYLFLPVNGMAAGYQEGLDSVSKTLAAKISKAGKTNVAVVDFTDLQGSITELGRFVAEELSVNLAMAEKQFSVVDRIHLRNILAEQKLSISGLLNPKNAKKLGKIAGVDAIIIGSITPFGDNIRITFKVIATDTANIISAERISIAKTGAVEELLSREITAPRVGMGNSSQTSPSVRSTNRRSQVKPFQNSFLKVSLVSATLSKKNKRFNLALNFVNLQEKENIRLSIGEDEDDKVLIDNLGNDWILAQKAVGIETANRWPDGSSLTPGQSVTVLMIFKPRKDDAVPGSIFHFSALLNSNVVDDFSIGLQGIQVN